VIAGLPWQVTLTLKEHAACHQPAVSVLPNDQQGRFGPRIVSAVAGTEPLITLAAADFDRDGDLDLATRQGLFAGTPGTVLVLLNDGPLLFIRSE
jgi:hypothetical protein